VRIREREEGDVRANSSAVERPMPEEAPVMRIVWPWRREEMKELIFLRD
jgi:hypothetical protein